MAGLMRIRRVLGVLGLIVVQCVCAPAAWAQGGASPAPQREHTVFVELRPPYERNRVALQKALKVEGYESFPEGEREVALVLTEAQIGKLFRARVRIRTVEGSATGGLREVPYLEGARIPARFEKLARRAYFDPQR